jgi:hypothetical protein
VCSRSFSSVEAPEWRRPQSWSGHALSLSLSGCSLSLGLRARLTGATADRAGYCLTSLLSSFHVPFSLSRFLHLLFSLSSFLSFAARNNALKAMSVDEAEVVLLIRCSFVLIFFAEPYLTRSWPTWMEMSPRRTFIFYEQNSDFSGDFYLVSIGLVVPYMYI